MERRTFIQLAALALADLTIAGPVGCSTLVPAAPEAASSSSSKGKVVLCLRNDGPSSCRLRLFDWDNYAFEEVTVPIGLIHSVAQSRHDPNVLYLFEIFGSCLRYDLSTKAFVKSDHLQTHEMFNGHGTLSESGEFIACTELAQDVGSILRIRSAKDFAKVAIAPKECWNSHQVVTLPGTSMMAAGVMAGLDGKKAGAIAFYDSEKRQLANRIDFPYPVLHLLPLSSSEVIGITLLTRWKGDHGSRLSSERTSTENIKSFERGQTFVPGPLYYASVDGRTKTLWNERDKALFIDNFGLAGISKTKFLSGHHGSGKVILWDDFKISHVFPVPNAKNLVASRDGSEFLVLSAERLMLYSLKTLEKIRDFDSWPDVVTMSSYTTGV